MHFLLQLKFSFIIFNFIFYAYILFSVYLCFACTYTCGSRVHLVPIEPKSMCWISWSWSYWWLYGSMWVLEIKHESSEKSQVLLITEQNLQPLILKKKKKILCLYLVISIFLQLLSTQFKIITMVRFSPNSGISFTPPYLMLVELSSYMTCYLPLCMPSSLCPNERHCTFYSPHRRTFYSYKYP